MKRSRGQQHWLQKGGEEKGGAGKGRGGAEKGQWTHGKNPLIRGAKNCSSLSIRTRQKNTFHAFYILSEKNWCDWNYTTVPMDNEIFTFPNSPVLPCRDVPCIGTSMTALDLQFSTAQRTLTRKIACSEQSHGSLTSQLTSPFCGRDNKLGTPFISATRVVDLNIL